MSNMYYLKKIISRHRENIALSNIFLGLLLMYLKNYFFGDNLEFMFYYIFIPLVFILIGLFLLLFTTNEEYCYLQVNNFIKEYKPKNQFRLYKSN